MFFIGVAELKGDFYKLQWQNWLKLLKAGQNPLIDAKIKRLLAE